MRRRWFQRSVLVVTLASAGLTHASIPENPGELWAARYNGPGNSADRSYALAVAPDGARIFVTGASAGASDDIATVAFSAEGTQLWEARYDGPEGFHDVGTDIAVSPDGSIVFVTGVSETRPRFSQGSDALTMAYDATTGAELWVARYNGPSDEDDGASSLAVSPDGSTVFVTGYSTDPSGTYRYDYITIAYDVSDGSERWLSRYDGPASDFEVALEIATSPDGATVFVTGWSEGPDGTLAYATIAYSADDGAPRWVSRYDGSGHSTANALVVSPDGSTVFVTGSSEYGPVSRTSDYVTIAYAAATGAVRWVSRFNSSLDDEDRASSIGVSPDGSAVFVTGYSVWGRSWASDYVTVAYSASSGARLWIATWGSESSDSAASALAVSPDGSKLYVTGYSTRGSQDYTTVAYSPTNGAELWVIHHDGPGGSTDTAYALAVSPDGGSVYVTGASTGTNSSSDYGLLAYRATGCSNGRDEAGPVSGPVRTGRPFSDATWPYLHGANCDLFAANGL